MATLPSLRAAISASLAVPASLSMLPGLVVAAHPDVKHVPIMVARDQGANSLVAAGAGHVVAVRRGEHRTELVELRLGHPEPRPVREIPGGLAQPSVGTDASGRPVVVVRPYAAKTEEGPAGRCALWVVDLATGRVRDLPGSDGAMLGDLDRGQAVVVRQPDPNSPADRSPTVLLAGTRFRALAPLAPLDAAVSKATRGENDDAGGAVVEAIDVRGGRVAVAVRTWTEYGGASALATTTAGQPWTLLASSTHGEGGIGPRLFSGPQVTATGIRGFFDGAEDFGGYAGRWSPSGTLLRRVEGRDFGKPALVDGSAFDGDSLYARSDAACDEGFCGIAAFGPVPLG